MKYIDIHTHSSQHPDTISVISFSIENYIDITFCKQLMSIGWHPWNLIEEKENEYLQKLYKYAENSNVIAIGETGLDKLCKTPLQYQIQIFQEHILLSEKLQKPLIIHCVKCFAELIQIKKQHKPNMPWIVHGFNNKQEIADQLLKEGIKLSFGKALLNPLSNASNVIKQIRGEDYFLETDDSALFIEDIYNAAAMHCNFSTKELLLQQQINFNTIFNTQNV